MNTRRYIQQDIESICFQAGKMAFVAGPRQSGKTTMAKAMLKDRGQGAYYNWDEVTFRRMWTKSPSDLLVKTEASQKPLLVLDEIHKAKLWKRQIKGLYDTQNGANDIMVTGSARLNMYRKGSDSLMGRYFLFRLHPFSYSEMQSKSQICLPDTLLEMLLSLSPSRRKGRPDDLDQLFTFGPFPDPLFAANKRHLNLWQRGRIEKVVREDLRDMSRLPELSQIEMLVSLLPERSANPLSIQSLSEDLEVAYTTVKRWLTYLKELYYFFELKPYSKSLIRGIKKEGKLYLWDWSEIIDPGARFENLIACHLYKYCHYLTDSGVGLFELKYVRNKQKKEIDFLILQDGKPWLPIEAKWSEDSPSINWGTFMPQLGCKLGIQVVWKPQVYKLIQYDHYQLLILSADLLLKYLC